MTDRLYYNDSHRKEFEAKVLDCRPVKDKYEVVLDRTAFFPEGGGQYADTGYLDDVEVLDLSLIHICAVGCTSSGSADGFKKCL